MYQIPPTTTDLITILLYIFIKFGLFELHAAPVGKLIIEFVLFSLVFERCLRIARNTPYRLTVVFT